MRLVTASLVGLLLASPLMAQEPVRQEREHTVRKGDTLWDLARVYLSNPFQWPVIYEANPMVVEDPHWIYPNEVLVIPSLAGLTEPADAGPRMGVRATRGPIRTVFYRGLRPARSQSQRVTVLEEPELVDVPVPPGEFAASPYLADTRSIRPLAMYLRPIREDRPGRGIPTSAHPQDRVFLNYAGRTRPEPGQRMAIVRVGRTVDGARGARIIHPLGIVRVTRQSAGVMEGQIESQYGPVLPDQPVLAMELYPDFRGRTAMPVEGGADLRGRILEFVEDKPIHSLKDVAFIDLGRRDGVQVGDVFQAFLPERTVRERRPGELRGRRETLPPEVVAELRVVRVTDRHATVKVDGLVLPRLEKNLPVRRIRAMP
jgi:hypothetical protein